MNKKIKLSSVFISVVLLELITQITNCQTPSSSNIKSVGDSITLKEIIDIAVTTHPTVKVAEEAINNADARIGLAKTGYYPEADLAANFSNMGPVTKLTIPDMGTFQLFPENNYSASVNFRQVVYDFGRTRQNIEIENENKAIGELTIEQVKQKLSLFAVNTYYSLLFLQAAIRIKEEQADALNAHLKQVETMMLSGAATEYQILTTKVKISTVESQKTDLLAALKAQQASLNSLIGNDRNANPVVKNELYSEYPLIQSDSLLYYAYENRDEVIINQKRTSLAELRYGFAKLQNNPVLSLQASGGAKNGYVPYLNKIRPNYIIGLGIRVPLFDGMKSRYNISQAQSAINSLSYESENTRRIVSNELSDAEAYREAAARKIDQFELQLAQAERAYSMAETSFKSGVITNLDLLDANTTVSESRLMLLKARIDYAASLYKLKAVSGERIY